MDRTRRRAADAAGHYDATPAGTDIVQRRPAVPHIASAYIGAYVRVSGASRDAVLDWLPLVAGARLAADVPETAALLKMLDRRAWRSAGSSAG